MPTHAELHRNGSIRLIVGALVLMTVGVVAGWRTLAEWPALVVAADMTITVGWLLTHRRHAAPRAVVPAGLPAVAEPSRP